MADRLFEAMRGGAPAAQGAALLRTRSARATARRSTQITVFRRRLRVHLRQREPEVRRSRPAARRRNPRPRRGVGPRIEPSIEGIRATVVGASQYTVQVSGSTIYVAPLDALPLRNVPVIAPELPLDADTIDAAAIAARDPRRAQAARPRTTASSRSRCSCRWRGSATFAAARCVLPRRGRGLGDRARAAATRSCWSATATSAA